MTETICMDVDTALSEVPVNALALIDDTDFKSREESVVYNQSGLDLVWNFVTTAGAFTQTAVTPTDTAGDYDWVNQGNGMYTIEIPDSGGASINNDTEGYGWFTGFATGILPWKSPVICFRAAALNNALIDGGDVLDVSLTEINGTAQRATDLAEIAQYLFANSAVLTDIIANDAVIAKLLATGGDISEFDEDSDSLQSVRDAIAAAADIRVTADAASTVTDGTVQSGTYASTQADDGTRWEVQLETDNDTNVDVTTEHNQGAGRSATEVHINGYYDAGGVRACQVYAWNYTTAGWDKLSSPGATTEMRNDNADNDYDFPLNAAHTDQITTPGEVKIRFYTDGGGDDDDELHLDYVYINSAASGGTSPQAIALAVHTELDSHLTHIPCFTGEIRYVSKSGSDANSGHVPDSAFLTIGAAIAASSAGDRIVVKAGTYDENGLDLNLVGLELICEIGTIIKNTNPGTVLTVSANSCIVCCVLLEPASGQIGFALSGSYGRFNDVYPHVDGLKSFEITGEHNVFNRCRADNYSSIGFDIQNEENIFNECIANGAGTATRGFYLSHTDTHDCLLNACVSNNNDTAGYELVSGADNNTIRGCTSNAETTPYIDNGTGNTVGVNSVATHDTDIKALLPAALVSGRMSSDAVAISGDSTAADNLELALENGTAGYVASDMKYLDGGAQSATDLKDFSDAGYDPATNKVQGVLLTDTTTTVTGGATEAKQNTAQNDLDLVTGADGATLATLQGNYAPNKVVPDVAGTAAGLHSTTDGLINGLDDITVADIIAGVADGSYDLQEMLRVIFSACSGKSNGGGGQLLILEIPQTAKTESRQRLTQTATGQP